MAQMVVEIFNRGIINMKQFREFFSQLKDGKYLLESSDMRKRSNQQNAYYWSVIVPMVRSALYEQGWDDVRTNEDAHGVLKEEFLKVDFVNRITGEVKKKDRSTAKLSISEFNEYIELVCKWASEFLGIYIPSPNEGVAIYSNWIGSQIQSAENDL